MYIVGIGPGNPLDRTRRAENAILESDVVVGYRLYLSYIRDLTSGKTIVPGGMLQEVDRCREALRRARDGAIVSLVSSGDPGVYGMAGPVLELAPEEAPGLPIHIVPGITAANAAAAKTGAPLMLDYACISLSDLLVDWPEIRTRLEAAARAGFVTVLYNPRSRKRLRQFEEALAIFRNHLPPSTPAAVATAVGSDEESITLTDLEHLAFCEVTMRSVVTVGNGATRRIGQWLVTPRGYRL